jgi:hypothetical protein
MKKWLHACVVTGLMMTAACTAAPPATDSMPIQTFEQMQQIRLNVAKVEVSDEYQAPTGNGHVEYMFPVTPATATRQLIEKKLLAQGDQNILRVIIEDASAQRETLQVTNDFWGTFRNDPAERYMAQVKLRFELVSESAPDIVKGHASVIGKRGKTVMENASPADRDQAMTELNDALMADVYDGLNTVVRNTFGMPY